jgi:predicted RecB family nuclease
LRIIFACGVALAIRYLWESVMWEEHMTGKGHYLPALFFFVGMFPESGLHFIRKTFKSRLGDKENSMEVRLSTIDGLSIFNQFRLQEEGIDTVQNLATADPIELAIKTRFTFQTIQDWIAQAKLCLLFPHHIKKFKEIGIRTVHDFITLHQEKRLADIAKVVDIPAEVLTAAAHIQEKKEKSGKVPQKATQ